MIKFGQITAYNEKTHEAHINYVRPDACAKCGACGSLNKVGSIDLPCDGGKEGNWVRITFPDRHFLGSAAIAYVIPLAAFIGGVLGGYLLGGKNELWGLFGGLFGLGLSLLILRIAEKNISKRADWVPVIDCIYEEKPADLDEIGCCQK